MKEDSAKLRLNNLDKSEEYYTIPKSIRILGTDFPLGVYVSKDHQIKASNRTLQVMSGYNEDELRGMDPILLVHPEERQSICHSIKRLPRNNLKRPLKYRMVTKGGNILLVLEIIVRPSNV